MGMFHGKIGVKDKNSIKIIRGKPKKSDKFLDHPVVRYIRAQLSRTGQGK